MKTTAMREDAVTCDGVTINFRFCHTRRRTLGMTVLPDQSVIVRVPMRTSLAVIRDFVSRRAGWIVRVRERFAQVKPPIEQGYEEGAVFRFQGAQYRLVIDPGENESVITRGDRLVVCTPVLDQSRIRSLIGNWYLEQAREIFKQRIVECHRLMEREAIPLPPITIRPMTSRWGSYSYRTRRISLNLNLIKAPLACLDYVIIHELCHIKVRHHGPGFWEMVQRYVPDHLELRKRLRFISC